MRPAPLLVALLVATSMTLMPSASAGPCHGNTITITVGADTLYIDETGQPGGQQHTAIYLENNRRGGLQRGGDGALSGQTFPFLIIGFCSDSEQPDARLYP